MMKAPTQLTLVVIYSLRAQEQDLVIRERIAPAEYVSRQSYHLIGSPVAIDYTGRLCGLVLFLLLWLC